MDQGDPGCHVHPEIRRYRREDLSIVDGHQNVARLNADSISGTAWLHVLEDPSVPKLGWKRSKGGVDRIPTGHTRLWIEEAGMRRAQAFEEIIHFALECLRIGCAKNTRFMLSNHSGPIAAVELGIEVLAADDPVNTSEYLLSFFSCH
jgi:hypothetical protein